MKAEDLKRIIQSLPGHIYWKDLEGRYLGCNLEHLKYFGFSSYDEIIGKTDYDLPWKAQADDVRKIDQKVIKTKSEIITEETSNFPGKRTVFLSRKMPMYDDLHRVIGIIGISLDITELKDTQKELQSALAEIKILANSEREKILKRHEQFMDDQAHDIRTPVGGIISGTQVLPSIINNSPKDAIDWITEIHKAATQILDYQESLLHDLYHGLRKSRTIFARFNLADILERLYKIFLPTAKTKHLNFSYSLDNTIPNYLIGDTKRIYQCLLDLIGNAMKFTTQGEVVINVSLSSQSIQQAIVRFSVRDTGIGIAEDMQHEIYEEFVKVARSNQTQTQGHGRGLGLSRVKYLVDLMQGELWLESQLGQGSCFNMAIPCQISIDQAK